MITDFQNAIFDEQTRKILAVLAKMKLDIDDYKKRENANQSFIEQREKTLSALLEYITFIVPEQIDHLTEINTEAYNTGYNTGYEAAENKYVWKPNKLDKENFRTFEILRLKAEMPELF